MECMAERQASGRERVRRRSRLIRKIAAVLGDVWRAASTWTCCTSLLLPGSSVPAIVGAGQRRPRLLRPWPQSVSRGDDITFVPGRVGLPPPGPSPWRGMTAPRTSWMKFAIQHATVSPGSTPNELWRRRVALSLTSVSGARARCAAGALWGRSRRESAVCFAQRAQRIPLLS
jgi:hypothetical protein